MLTIVFLAGIFSGVVLIAIALNFPPKIDYRFIYNRPLSLIPDTDIYNDKYSRNFVYIIAIASFVFSAFITYFYFKKEITIFSETYKDVPLQAVVLSISATLATIGWVTSARYSQKSSIRVNTYNVLTDFRNSISFSDHRANFYDYCDLFKIGDPEYSANAKNRNIETLSFEQGGDRNIQFSLQNLKELIEQQKDFDYNNSSNSNFKYPVIDSIQFISNFYEFIAVGIKTGIFDEKLLKLTMRGLFMRFYLRVQVFILEDRRIDEYGKPTSSTYENMYYLAKKWYIEDIDHTKLLNFDDFIQIRKSFKILEKEKQRTNVIERHKVAGESGASAAI